MLDTNKIPHLQPETEPPLQTEDPLPEPLTKQIMSIFLCKKSLFYLSAVLLLIYFVLCIQGERLLRQGVYNIFKQLGQDGFGISYQAPSSYLDFKSGLNLDDLVITAPEAMGGWTLKAGRVSVASTPFMPHRIILEFNGTHSLKTKTIGDIRFVIGNGAMALNLAEGKEPFSVTLILKQLQTASPKSMEGFFISDLSLNVLQAIENKEKKEMRFSLRSDLIHLPAYISQHLPPIIRDLIFNGRLTETDSDGAKSFLQNWQEGSGTIEIEHGKMDWKPFSAQFNGTFGLDKSFEIVGAGIAKAYNFFALLDKLQEGNYLLPRRVSVAKVVLGEQLKTEKNDKLPSLSSAFSFQSGKIYIGQVLLYDRDER